MPNRVDPYSKKSHFYNFFLDENGTHMSIGTAVAMGLISRGIETGTLIVRGRKMSEQAAIEEGIIDAMAAAYLAALPDQALSYGAEWQTPLDPDPGPLKGISHHR